MHRLLWTRRRNVNMPEAGACWFLCAVEDRCTMFVLDGEGLFGKKGCAVSITKCTHTEEVVGESGYNVVGAGSMCWKVMEG